MRSQRPGPASMRSGRRSATSEGQMGEALERVLRDGPGVDKRAGIALPLLELMAQDMLRFGSAHCGFAGLPATPTAAVPVSDLPARLLGYVVDGAHPQTLARIQVTPGWSISSHDNDGKARGVRWQLYDRWEELPPTVLLRFARVLAAGSGLVASNPALELSRLHPWVETLVRDLVGLPVSHRLFSETSCHPHRKASIERLAAVLEAGDLTLEAFLRSAFTSKLGSTRANSVDFVAALRGFGTSLAQHKAALAPLFRDPAFAQRLRALSLLTRAGPEASSAFADELVDLALDASRQIRDGAWPLAKKLGDRARSRARHQAMEAAPEQRSLALRLLWEIDLPGDRELVHERGKADKAQSVRKAVAGLVSVSEVAVNARLGALRVPDVRIDVAAPLSPEAHELLKAWLASADSVVSLGSRRAVPARQEREEVPFADLAAEIVAAVEVPRQTVPSAQYDRGRSRYWALWVSEAEAQYKSIVRWLAAPGVQPIHVIRLLRLT